MRVVQEHADGPRHQEPHRCDFPRLPPRRGSIRRRRLVCRRRFVACALCLRKYLIFFFHCSPARSLQVGEPAPGPPARRSLLFRRVLSIHIAASLLAAAAAAAAVAVALILLVGVTSLSALILLIGI